MDKARYNELHAALLAGDKTAAAELHAMQVAWADELKTKADAMIQKAEADAAKAAAKAKKEV